MRTVLLFLALCTSFFVTGIARAQPHQDHLNLTESLSRSNPKKLGDYGYRHHELHHTGVVASIIEHAGQNCCDGGEGGECRVTKLQPHHGGGFEAFLDGKWCPIPETVPILYSTKLLMDNTPVVCASERKGADGCPIVFCAAAAWGS